LEHNAMSRSPARRSRRANEGDPLTAREIQVLALVAAGEPTPAIGRLLGVAESTIKSHLTNVYKKTGSLNRVQAARHYLDHYTAPGGRGSLIERQLQEIQARLDQLAPATREAERLQHALDALRAVQPDRERPRP
jgi:DNA-binding CsgD family transcriptional regulator